MAAFDGGGVRARAASAARALVDGRIDWEDFLAEFGDVADPQIAELVNLVAQEPEIGGFSGVRPGQYRRYRQAIEHLIRALEGDA